MKRWKKIRPVLCRGFPVLLLFVSLANPYLFGKVNLSTTSGESLWPAIGVNSAGEVMVVWTEWSSGQIHYRILRNGQWTATKNAGIVNQTAWSNQMSVDSKGRFHITYADGYSSYSRDIYYSYFTGSSWSTPECVHVSPYNSAWNKMDIDKDDKIHVAWYHSNVPKDVPVSSDIVTKSKNFLASWPARYEDVSRTPEYESIHPAIGVLNGNVYTCYMEAQYPRRLYFCEKIGGTWRAPYEIRRTGYYPDMVVDGSGNVHIAFSLRDGNFHYISRTGGRWNADEVISNGECPLQFGDIAHKNNVIVAAWIQGTNGNWSVYAAGKMVGDKWVIPVKIADTPGGGDGNKHVQVALDDRNCAHFVWEGIGTGGKHDIFYEKYCVDTPKDATFIEVDNSYLSFHTDDSSSNPGPQTFRVRASGAGSINYSISKDKSWITVSPTQGSSSGEWDTITVSVDASGLNDGTYNGSIKISDPDAYNNPVDVGVTLTIGEGGGGGGGGVFLETDKTNMEFKMEEGANPPAKSFNLRATGGKALNYSVTTNKPWLAVFPEEGTVSSSWTTINVSIEADQMQPGNFKGRIDVTAAGASNKVSVFVDLTIEKSKVPSIQIDRSRLYFWGYAHGDNPPSSSFKIRNSGSQTLKYKISSNKEWLKLTPVQGSSTGEWDTINVTASSTSLAAGKHLANIQITASGADNSPQSISVEFEVEMPPQPYPPVGITVKRMNHEGLVFQDYKSKIEWGANPRNDGLFTIVKYYIFRKDKYQHNAPWIFVGEVPGNVFVYYDGGFSSKEERNKYNYTVSSVDGSGKESMRPESADAYGILKEGAFHQEEKIKKESPENKKIR